jgi:hypothetical protein
MNFNLVLGPRSISGNNRTRAPNPIVYEEVNILENRDLNLRKRNNSGICER